MNKIFLNFLFIILFLILLVSCKKEKQETNLEIDNDNIHDIYIKNNLKNIYHSKYTNVVKIQGKYVERDDYFEYFYFGGRVEGEYNGYDIFDAIRFGSLQKVIEITEENNSSLLFEINNEELEYNKFMDDDYNVNGATTLILAIFYRDIGIIKYLLDSSEKMLDDTTKEWYLLDADNDGWNAFAWACAVGTVDIIKTVVEKYPDYVYWKTSYGANGLHMASLSGNISVFDYLVNDLGLDINSSDNNGDNVLYYSKDAKTSEALLRLGAIYNF